MNFGLFGVRNVKPAGNPKKRERSETSLNLRCAARVADTSHGIFRRKRTYPHVPLTRITRHEVCSVSKSRQIFCPSILLTYCFGIFR